MFEKNEWWIVLLAFGLGIWYFLKKGQSATGQSFFASLGSLVNPTNEVLSASPAQTTTPVLFRPAQPATGTYMTRIGTFMNVPGPAQNIPVTRYNVLTGYRGMLA